MAALFPAAVALQFARGRAQRALMVLSWLATVCVGLAAEYVDAERARPGRACSGRSGCSRLPRRAASS